MAEWTYDEMRKGSGTIPPYDGTGIAVPLDPTSGMPVAPTGVWLHVPSTIYTPVGVHTVYWTSLTNYGPEIDANARYTFAWEDGRTMLADDLEYATQDSGIPTVMPLTLQDNSLFATLDYPIPAKLDAVSAVRIKVNRPGTLMGNTLITKDGTPEVIANIVYSYAAYQGAS